MNPFIESPLAVPQPGARWRRVRRCPGSRERHADSGGTRARSRTRTPARLLRLALLSGALLAPGMAAAIDLNSATSEQLQELKGIGPKMAKVIIEERGRGGRYASIEDLSERVKGIGPKKAAALVASGLEVGAASKAGHESAAGGAGAGGARRSR